MNGNSLPEGLSASLFLSADRSPLQSPYTAAFPAHKMKIGHHVAKVYVDPVLQLQLRKGAPPYKVLFTHSWSWHIQSACGSTPAPPITPLLH